MSYLSIEFSVLFIVFLPVYWGLARYPNGQNWLLLFVSYAIVSSYSLQFALILFVYTCAVHFFACGIYHSKQHAKSWLVVALCIVTTNLAVFKYFDFFRYELQEETGTILCVLNSDSNRYFILHFSFGELSRICL